MVNKKNLSDVLIPDDGNWQEIAKEANRFEFGDESAYWEWVVAKYGHSLGELPLSRFTKPIDLLVAARLQIGRGEASFDSQVKIEGLGCAVENANLLGLKSALEVFVPILLGYLDDNQLSDDIRAKVLIALAFDDWSNERFDSAEARFLQAAALQKGVSSEPLALSETYTGLGLVYDTLGKLDEAEAYLKLALDLQPLESLPKAMTYFGLGNTSYSREEFSRAKMWYIRALKLREKLHPDSILLAASYYAMGVVAKEKYNAKEALDWFQKAFVIEERLVPNSQTVSATLHELGNTALGLLRFDEAEAYYRRAAALDLPDSLGLASSYHALANLEDLRGNLVGALKWYRRSLSIRRRVAPESLDTALAYFGLGGLYESWSELDRSERWYRKALAIQERLIPDGVRLAATYSSLGGVARSRGNDPEAEVLFRQAESILRRNAPQSLELASTLSAMAGLAQSRGRADESEAHYVESFAIAESVAPGGLEVAEALHGLGSLARERENPRLALRYFRRSLRIEKRLAPDSLSLASSYAGVGAALLQLSRHEEGEAFLNQALEMQNRIAPEGLDAAATLHQLGHLHWQNESYEDAESYFKKALQIREGISAFSLEVAETCHAMGALARARALWTEADRCFSKALTIVFNQAAEMDVRQGAFLLDRFSTLLLDAVEAALEVENHTHALSTMEQVKGFKLLQVLGIEDLTKTAQGQRTLLRYRESESRYEAAFSAFRTALKHKRPELRKEVRRAARERSKAGKELFSRQAGIVDIDASDLNQTLGPDSVALQYVRLGESDEYLTIGFWDGMLHVTSPVSIPSKEVGRWRTLGELRGAEIYSLWSGLSREQGEKFFPPEVADALRRASRVLIAPDSDLFDLNFALLTVPGADGMLGTKSVVSHTPTFSAYVASYRRKRTTARTSFVGGVTYTDESLSGRISVRRRSSRGARNFDPLTYTQEEAVEVATLMNTEAKVNEAVNGESVIAALQTCDVVHLAVHGVEGESGFDTGLVLHPPHRITADDLSKISIKSASLVLSACVSAAGKQYTGVGRVGLLHLAIHQGATAATGAVWSIDDKLAYDFMSEAYRRWTVGALTWGEVMRQMLDDGGFPLRIAGSFVTYGCPDVRWASGGSSR